MVQPKFWSWSSALGCVVCAACATTLTSSSPRGAIAANESPPPSAAASPAALASAAQPSLAAVSGQARPGIAAGDPRAPKLNALGPMPALENRSAANDAARYEDVLSEKAQRARGLYFSAPMARRLGVEGITRILRGSRLDAAVIDVKDDAGRITFDSKIQEFAQSRHVFLRDLPEFLQTLKRAGIHTVARIVCFNDPILPRVYPERSVIDTRPGHAGAVWNLHKGRNTWLDPSNEKNHDLLIALATEVESLGFDEIQLDYIRFPVDEGTKFATFPGEQGRPRRDILLGFLRRMDEALHVPLGVDVFGLTAFKHGDPAGLGQSLEDWAAHIDVFSPMLYVNGMKGWLSRKEQQRAGLLVEAGVRTLRERVGPGPVIRPFLQAFESGADYWSGEFVAEQIRGARSGGGDGFLFWNPGSNYGMVREGMAGATGEIPFRIDERIAERQRRSLNQPSAVARGSAAPPATSAREVPASPAAHGGESSPAAPQGS